MSELINRFRAEYVRTKKSLGQHFLTNKHFINEIADAAGCGNIIEIGPGCGVLTEVLAKNAKQITVIDIDDIAVEFLSKYKDEFFPNINIIHSDLLKVNLGTVYADSEKMTIVGNLPYNVSVKILEYCTSYISNIESMVFMFQKEVAARVASACNSKDYSSLSVFISYYFNITKIRDISGSNFWPNANVMSTVLKFTPKSERLLPQQDERPFFSMVRAAFHQKRKTLSNNLKSHPGVDISNLTEVLSNFGLPATARAEQLSLQNFIVLYDKIKL